MFMVSAGLFATLLEYPHSAVHQALADPTVRRALMGLAMGLTAIGIIYSPWGQQSGAHINPAVTLTFLRLGKVAKWDAVFYIAAQFLGGTAGVLLVVALLGQPFTDVPVRYVATVPGSAGAWIAFGAEFAMSAGLMFTILAVMNSRRYERFTGVSAGILVATYIAFEAPLSGMSINPARTFASAAPGGAWEHAWVYYTAPLLGMLAGAELYRVAKHGASVKCAKLDHAPHKRCIHCGYEPRLRPLRDKTTTSESDNPAPQAISIDKRIRGHGRNSHE
jgi:aquaporin Z